MKIASNNKHSGLKYSSGFTKLEFKNDSTTSDLDVEYYKGPKLNSLKDIFDELGTTNSVLFILRKELPKNNLLFLIREAGLKRSFNRFCNTLAFCTSINAIDTKNNVHRLDSFAILDEPRISDFLGGMPVTQKTIFINSIRNNQFISTYETVLNLAHELYHQEMWSILGTRRHHYDIPTDLADLICIAKEREAVINLYTFLIKNPYSLDDSKLFGINNVFNTLNNDINRLKKELISIYEGLEAKGVAGYLNMDKKMLTGLQLFGTLHFDIKPLKR